MINPKELRIGNLVGFYLPSIKEIQIGHIRSIENFNEDDDIVIYGYSVPEFSEHTLINENGLIPIPLTEEWLVKFGFTKDKMNPKILNNGISVYKSDVGSFHLVEYCEFGEMEDLCSCLPIKSVHQLQNLYFCLCGKELELNQ